MVRPASDERPTLDEVVARPELANALPSETRSQLLTRMGEILVALGKAPPPAVPPSAVAPALAHDELLDVREAARRLGMSPDTLYHRVKRSPYLELTVRNGTRNLRFSTKAIEEFIERRRR